MRNATGIKNKSFIFNHTVEYIPNPLKEAKNPEVNYVNKLNYYNPFNNTKSSFSNRQSASMIMENRHNERMLNQFYRKCHAFKMNNTNQLEESSQINSPGSDCNTENVSQCQYQPSSFKKKKSRKDKEKDNDNDNEEDCIFSEGLEAERDQRAEKNAQIIEEMKMEDKRIDLKKKMKEVQARIEECINEFNTFNQEREDLKVDVIALEHLEEKVTNQYIMMKNQAYSNRKSSGKSISKGKRQSNNARNNSNNKSDIQRLSSLLSPSSTNDINREPSQKNFSTVICSAKMKYAKDQKLETITSLDSKLIKLKEEIAKNERLLNKVHEKHNKIIQELYNYYHEILSEGRDTRKHGLIWLIKRIWNIGANVLLTSFPKYLDDTSIQYLFTYANMSVLYDKVSSRFRELYQRKMNKKKLRKMERKTNEQQEKLSSTNRNIDPKQKLTQELSKMTQRPRRIIIDDDPEYTIVQLAKLSDAEQMKRFTFNQIQKEGKDWVDLDNEMIEENKELNLLEKRLIKQLSEMRELKRKELDRINKEFYKNYYSRRFNVTHEVIVNALIGAEGANEEIVKLEQEKKEYFKMIKMLRCQMLLPQQGSMIKSKSMKDMECNYNA